MNVCEYRVNINKLTSENERLREALQKIVTEYNNEDGIDVLKIGDIAEKALESESE